MSERGRQFMVECYVSGITQDQVVAGVARLKEVTEQMGREGLHVNFLGSTFLPAEGSVFCLFRGPSEESVEEANRRARFPFHRVAEAVLLR